MSAHIGTARMVGCDLPLVRAGMGNAAAPTVPVTAGLVAQWIGDQYTPGTWPDASGNNSAATQATSSKQPALVAGALNGHAVVRFDGVDDALAAASITLGGWMILKVWRASAGMLLEAGPNAFQNPPGLYVYTDIGSSYFVSRAQFLFDAKDLAAGWGQDNTWRVTTYACGGTAATHRLYIDGAVQTGTETGNVDPTTNAFTQPLNIGSRDQSSIFLNGDIAEMVVFDTDLADADRQAVESYLGRKYGIAITH